MFFSIIIPNPKIGIKIPLHLISNQDTIKVLSMKFKNNQESIVPKIIKISLVDNNNKLIECKIVEIKNQKEIPLNIIYNGIDIMFYIEILNSDYKEYFYTFCPIIFEVKRY